MATEKTYTVELTAAEIMALFNAAYELENLKDHAEEYRFASDTAFKMAQQAGL